MLESNIEIEKYLQNYDHFLGCFSKSNLPSFPTKFPSTIIINDNKEHWVSVVLFENKCFYFDSFGVETVDEEIIKFLKFKYSEIFANKQVIQDVSSYSCGKFCVAFIKNVSSKETFISFLTLFSDILLKNDSIVMNYI